MSSFLDQFPTEIFHLIFQHLWAHEILYSFININDYLNNVLLNYQNYLINFESIRKSHFDLVCHYLRPEQIISLILSDKSETPNQSQLFRSLFSIKQFHRLRSLKLIKLDDNGESFMSDLCKLPHLMSLEIDVTYGVPFIQSSPLLERIIINTPENVFFFIDPSIAAIRFEQLRYLSLSQCPCLQLQQIFRQAVRLTSLKVSLAILTSEEYHIFTDFHQEQPIIPPLVSLSLTFNGADGSFLDAYHWENFLMKYLPNLTIFNFEIHSSRMIDRNVIEQYRCPFWLDRHWYVACNISYSALLTVPYFAPTSNLHALPPIPPDFTTLPIEQHVIFYDNITKLRFDEDTCQLPYRYNYVEELVLCTPYKYENILDLSTVKSFIVATSKWSFYEMITMINEAMPLVDYLSLNLTYFDLRNQRLPDISLPQIRTLRLPTYGALKENNLFNWFRYFPCVERLSASINSKKQIQFLIDHFQTMLNGYFYIYKHYMNPNKKIQITRQWLQKHTSRLRTNTTNNFICQIDNRFSFSFSLSLWIANNDQTEQTRKRVHDDVHWWQQFLPKISDKIDKIRT